MRKISVAEQRLGLPQTSRDAFDMLHSALVIDENTVKRLKAMVSFTKITVHDYQTVNIDSLQQIIENHLGNFTDFTKQILKF